MPEATVLAALFFGFLLGIKHALDADHIVAVTTIVSRSGSLLRSAIVGLSWGLGHTLTLFAAGLAVLVFRLTIPDKLSLGMEFAVGVMLVLLGAPLVWQLLKKKHHLHMHQHGESSHIHSHSHEETPEHEHKHIRRPLLMGMIHGLAGSGVLTLLVLNTMSSVGQGLVFLLVFGVGSILGMVLFSGAIGLPFRFISGRSRQLSIWLRGAAGSVSVVLGLVIMWQIAVAGLFLPG
jgi:sulfite exporter TauE/SafE